MFNSISLQLAFDCSISLQYTMQKIFTKLQVQFQNEERNDEKELLQFSKVTFHIRFLSYPDTTSFLVDIDSQVASVHWYFLELFPELSYHLISRFKGKILDDFAFLLHFEIVWLLSL